jgi:hypothetical protein
MKSAYELAMERLEKNEPTQTLTEEQKQSLANTDARFQAKIAERDVFLSKQISVERAQGNWAEAAAIQEQLAREKTLLNEERETAKNKIRNS